VQGRRVSDRRTTSLAVAAPELPRKLERYAQQLVFFERIEPTDEQAEDADTARLVIRFQAGDEEAFAGLYVRYFNRVYVYLRTALNDPIEAEDAAQHVFMRVYEALPRYERRGQPFRGWLFRIVRNYTLDQLKKLGRNLPTEPELLRPGLDL
jgi:hypothetical protein